MARFEQISPTIHNKIWRVRLVHFTTAQLSNFSPTFHTKYDVYVLCTPQQLDLVIPGSVIAQAEVVQEGEPGSPEGDRPDESQFFSTLDLASGYWQVAMDPEHRAKTAFATRSGLYEFNIMPFGLSTAPATSERLMKVVMRGIQWKRCLVYLDDVICIGTSFEDALANLRLVFDRLWQAGLKLKPKKC